MTLTAIDGGLDFPDPHHEPTDPYVNESAPQLSGVNTAGETYAILGIQKDDHGSIASLGNGGGWRQPAKRCE